MIVGTAGVVVVGSGLVSTGSVDVDSDGTDDVVTLGAGGVVVGSDDVVIVGAGVVVVGSRLVSDGSVDVDSDGFVVVLGSDVVVNDEPPGVVVGSVTVVSDVDEPVKKLVIVEMIEVVVLS